MGFGDDPLAAKGGSELFATILLYVGTGADLTSQSAWSQNSMKLVVKCSAKLRSSPVGNCCRVSSKELTKALKTVALAS